MQNSKTPHLASHPAEGDHLAGEVIQHPYEPVDPFTASIPLRVWNNRRHDTINSIDEIGPPRTAGPGPPRTSHEIGLSSRSPNIIGGNRPSLESTNGRGRRPTSASVPIPVRRNAIVVTVPPSSPGPNDTQQVPVNQSYTENPYQLPSPTQANGTSIPRQSPSAQSLTARRLRRQSHLPSPHGIHFRRFGSPFDQVSDLSLLEDADEKASTSSAQHSPTEVQELTRREKVVVFFTNVLLQQIYLNCLLRLPYMYYSRVDQIFQDAQLTMEEIKEMALRDSVTKDSQGPQMPKAYSRLRKNWEGFIDNLMREWKTLNIISGLLLSGILTIFQIDGAQSDPITRFMAFWSLISALLSLLYGCFFIVRFSGMRRVHKAAEWAIEAQRQQTVFWNVWVMLAMPAIWLVWSILAYIACIMAFMWRIRPNEPNAEVVPRIGSATEDGFRIFICCVFGIGILYAILIVNTLRRYGSSMDKAWKRRIKDFRKSYREKLELLREPSSPVPNVGVVEATPPPRSTPPPLFSPQTPVIPTKPSSPLRASFTRTLHNPPSPSPLRGRRSLSPIHAILPEHFHRMSPESERLGSPQSMVETDNPQAEQNGALGLYFGKPGELDEPSSPDMDAGAGGSQGTRRSVDETSTETRQLHSDAAAGGIISPIRGDQHGDSDAVDATHSNIDQVASRIQTP